LGASQQPGCSNHYRNTDSDDYGNDLFPLCLCPSGGASIDATVEDPTTKVTTTYSYASKGGDCCDVDGSYYPGAGGWVSSGNGKCTLPFDKNCDGNQTKRYQNIVDDGCGLDGFECNVPAVGWRSE